MKVAEVVAAKNDLVTRGARVNVSRRNLARGFKVYLRVRALGSASVFYTFVLPIIQRRWPEAYMTSGSFTRDSMDVTVALTKEAV